MFVDENNDSQNQSSHITEVKDSANKRTWHSKPVGARRYHELNEKHGTNENLAYQLMKDLADTKRNITALIGRNRHSEMTKRTNEISGKNYNFEKTGLSCNSGVSLNNSTSNDNVSDRLKPKCIKKTADFINNDRNCDRFNCETINSSLTKERLLQNDYVSRYNSKINSDKSVMNNYLSRSSSGKVTYCKENRKDNRELGIKRNSREMDISDHTLSESNETLTRIKVNINSSCDLARRYDSAERYSDSGIGSIELSGKGSSNELNRSYRKFELSNESLERILRIKSFPDHDMEEITYRADEDNMFSASNVNIRGLGSQASSSHSNETERIKNSNETNFEEVGIPTDLVSQIDRCQERKISIMERSVDLISRIERSSDMMSNIERSTLLRKSGIESRPGNNNEIGVSYTVTPENRASRNYKLGELFKTDDCINSSKNEARTYYFDETIQNNLNENQYIDYSKYLSLNNKLPSSNSSEEILIRSFPNSNRKREEKLRGIKSNDDDLSAEGSSGLNSKEISENHHSPPPMHHNDSFQLNQHEFKTDYSCDLSSNYLYNSNLKCLNSEENISDNVNPLSEMNTQAALIYLSETLIESAQRAEMLLMQKMKDYNDIVCRDPPEKTLREAECQTQEPTATTRPTLASLAGHDFQMNLFEINEKFKNEIDEKNNKIKQLESEKKKLKQLIKKFSSSLGHKGTTNGSGDGDNSNVCDINATVEDIRPISASLDVAQRSSNRQTLDNEQLIEALKLENSLLHTLLKEMKSELDQENSTILSLARKLEICMLQTQNKQQSTTRSSESESDVVRKLENKLEQQEKILKEEAKEARAVANFYRSVCKAFRRTAMETSDCCMTFFKAVENNSLDSVKELLDKGKINVNVRDLEQYGQTGLHFAASKGNIDMVRMLVEKYSANYDLEDMFGEVPIHKAADAGHFSIVSYLVSKKCKYSDDVMHLIDTKTLDPSKEKHGDIATEESKAIQDESLAKENVNDPVGSVTTNIGEGPLSAELQ